VRLTGEAKGVYSGESAVADTAAGRRDKVEYEAGRITFEVPKNRIRLEDKAHLVYQDLSLRSPEVVFDSKKQVFEAHGNPMLEDRGDTLTGESLAYDLAARKGAVYGARTRYETGWYTGKKIRRLGESVLDVQGATYSTCNLLHPHYAFESNRMKIYLKDKIIARPVVLEVRGIPLLALPFYVFPIRSDRLSGIIVPQLQSRLRQRQRLSHPQRRLLLGAERLHRPPRSPRPPVDAVAACAARALGCSTSSRAISRGSYTPAMDAGGQNGGDFRAVHQQTIENDDALRAGELHPSADYTKDPSPGSRWRTASTAS
jgi:hypothetical protein